jgi:integrase
MAAKVERKTGPRGTSYWLVVHQRGRRQSKSYGKDRQAADAAARAINRKMREGAFGLTAKSSGPLLASFTERYLAQRIGYLSTREQRARKARLKAGGVILSTLGDRPLDAISGAVLLEWYEQEIQAKGRSRQTGAHYVNTLASVFRYAKALRHVRENPVDELRELLSDESRTKRGRAAQGSKANPIEDPEALSRLLEAAQADSWRTTGLVVLTLLDSGIRLGELRGLTWGQVVWGGEQGEGRHLLIDQQIPSGCLTPETTKSGYVRKVQLSRRLRSALLEAWIAQGQPGPDALVFLNPNGSTPFDGDNFRRRQWADLCAIKRVGVGARKLKDLRDSYASHLLSAGITLAYVSKQLGHQSMQLTERHYACWIPDGDEYRAPLELEPGEVPADLLARLTGGSRRRKTAQIAESASPGAASL